MIVNILSFLTDYHTIIVGAITTIAECIVVIVNTYRKIHSNNQTNQSLQFMSNTRHIPVKSTFLWSLNPINLFKPVS